MMHSVPFQIENALNRPDLLARLETIDIAVPGRGQGRTKDHRERWVAARLLATLSKSKTLSYPISCCKGESPDFVLRFGSLAVGLEHTDATREDFEEYREIAAREYPDALLEPAHFRWNRPRMTKAQMHVMLQSSRLTSEGWQGFSPEIDWIDFINASVKKKLEKLDSPTFINHVENWLAIYDNTPSPPGLFLDFALPKLEKVLAEHWTRNPGFQRIFVEHGDSLLCFSPAGCKQSQIADLWARKPGASPSPGNSL